MNGTIVIVLLLAACGAPPGPVQDPSMSTGVEHGTPTHAATPETPATNGSPAVPASDQQGNGPPATGPINSSGSSDSAPDAPDKTAPAH